MPLSSFTSFIGPFTVGMTGAVCAAISCSTFPKSSFNYYNPETQQFTVSNLAGPWIFAVVIAPPSVYLARFLNKKLGLNLTQAEFVLALVSGATFVDGVALVNFPTMYGQEAGSKDLVAVASSIFIGASALGVCGLLM